MKISSNPVDGAVVIADLMVSIAEENIKISETKKFKDHFDSMDVTGLDLGDIMSENFKNELKKAEKTQMVAFKEGNKMGAIIAIQSGKFGREVSEVMGEFIRKSDK